MQQQDHHRSLINAIVKNDSSELKTAISFIVNPSDTKKTIKHQENIELSLLFGLRQAIHCWIKGGEDRWKIALSMLNAAILYTPLLLPEYQEKNQSMQSLFFLSPDFLPNVEINTRYHPLSYLLSNLMCHSDENTLPKFYELARILAQMGWTKDIPLLEDDKSTALKCLSDRAKEAYPLIVPISKINGLEFPVLSSLFEALKVGKNEYGEHRKKFEAAYIGLIIYFPKVISKVIADYCYCIPFPATASKISLKR